MSFRRITILGGPRARQRGAIGLVDLALSGAIAIAFGTAGLWQQRQQVLSQQTAAQSNVLADIGNSINGKYLSLYYSNLINGTAVAGVANAYAPTLTELENINVVAAGTATTSVYGTAYVVKLAKTPVGCAPSTCDIAGLVYIAGAITDPSTGKPLTVDDGAAAIGGDGGYSDLITPGTITGINGGWNQPNPMGSVASILAMRIGYGSSGWSAFVRRDGSLPMEGDLNFQGTTGTLHNITNAATVNAQKVVTPAGNGVQVGGSYYYGDTVNSAIRQNGGLYIQNLAGSLPADIASVRNVNASGTVQATGLQVNGNANVAASLGVSGNATVNGAAAVGTLGVAGAASVNTTLSVGQGSYLYGGATVYNGVNVASGGIALTDGAQITNNGTQYIEPAGNLYLKPFNGNGITIVGGGGGSGQLTTIGRLTSNEYMLANGGAAVNTGCAPNGLIGNSGSGPLFCQGGIWRAAGVPNLVTRSASFGVGNGGRDAGGTTSCAANETLISGGVDCPSGDGLAFVMSNRPQGNGWYGYCGDAAGWLQPAVVYSLCGS